MLGPAAGGVRLWHYSDKNAAVTDALRLSQGMSYKNAMANLPMGGGKGVILAGESRAKTTELLAAFAPSVDSLCGRSLPADRQSVVSGKGVSVRLDLGGSRNIH